MSEVSAAGRMLGRGAAIPRLSARQTGLTVLVIAICVSPRIPVPLSVGRRFDLRLEDFVLLALFVAWAWNGDYKLLSRLQISRWFAAFLAAGLLSTLVNVILYGLPLLRGASFWGKYVEYFLIFATTAAWATTVRERRWLMRTLLALGLLNLIWVGTQLVTGSYRSVIELSAANEFSYGPGLIGEISPLSAGSFFLIQFLLWWALLANWRTWWAYAASAGTLFALVLTESRVSYLGSFVGAAVIAWRAPRRWLLLGGFLAAFLASNVGLVATGNPSAGRITGMYFMEQSFAYRFNEIWAPLARKYVGVVIKTPSSAAPTPAPTPRYYGHDVAPPPPSSVARKPPTVVQAVIGFGNGGMGFAPGLPTEAHDYFLRTFLETGVLGLVSFIGLLVSLLVFAFRRWRDPVSTGPDRVIAAALLATLAAFTASSLLQDMFFPVIPNELLWLLVGLAVAPLLAVTRAGSDHGEPATVQFGAPEIGAQPIGD
jgi:hypothetical protein